MIFPKNHSSKDRFHVAGAVVFMSINLIINKKREKEIHMKLNLSLVATYIATLKVFETKIHQKYIKKEMIFSICKFW